MWQIKKPWTLSCCELACHRPLESSAPLFFPHRSLGGRKRDGTRGGVARWKESYLQVQWEQSVPMSKASAWDFPKHDTHSAWMSSACRGDLHVLQWRCGICNNAIQFALLVRLLDRRRMAAGDDRISKLATARGPIRLLRHFNGESWRQRRISEEGSPSLKRRNLRCGSEVAAYIARRPSHFGELWRAA